MQDLLKKFFFAIGLLTMLVIFPHCKTTEPVEKIPISRTSDFNFGWKFILEKDATPIQGFEVSMDDKSWEDVRLPHDWSIGMDYDTAKYDGATGYLPGGIGWYRKTFEHSAASDERAFILFDGVYNNSETWINGQRLGAHPYGYSPFYYDITDYLNKDGKPNVLAVKVDRSRYIDSRWYTGSGIYRDVELITTKNLFIPVWGVFATTPKVSNESAEVVIQTQVRNEYKEKQDFRLKIELIDKDGKVAVTKESDASIAPNEESILVSELTVASPLLWSLDNPHLYKAKVNIVQNDALVDAYEFNLGIRSVRFDADKGFFLNEENMKIKGVCLHHDAGLVGAAVPDGVWRHRLTQLREGGINAIRIAHNPAAKNLLDLCDEMGFLVQDEFFDEWDYSKDKRLNQEERHDDYVSRGYVEHFQELAESDLKTVIKAHRNHPSIFQWSIGNEIEWTYHPRYRNITGYFNMNWQGNYFWELPPLTPEQIKERLTEYPPREYELAKTANKLAKWTKSMDTTRVVTANCILPSASHVTGYTDALDVVGYSYRRVLYDYGHELYPDKPIMGTENLGQWHEWKSVIERPHISGMFIWTGYDYLGESHGAGARKATPSGLLDVAGFKNGSYYMMQSLWTEAPMMHIATQTEEKSTFTVDKSTGQAIEKDPGAWKEALWVWQDVNEHWNYEPKQMVMVEIYSNCDVIELFLNDKSLGERKLTEFEDHIFKWGVPYEEGKLKAVGKKNGKVFEKEINTSTAPATFAITVDDKELQANQYDVAHIRVELVDKDGFPVRTDDKVIQFEVGDGLKVLGVDNGAPDNLQPHQRSSLKTSDGRALLIVQALNKEAVVNIKVSSEGMTASELKINVVK